MRRIVSVFLLLISVSAFSQKMLKGVVMDSALNKPVPSASIFLSNTSIGTKTDNEGKFQLWIPQGKYDLIISSIGYETFNSTIISADQPDFIRFVLKTKIEELETVLIEPYEKNGWNNWGRFFTDNFIGNSAFGKQCKIINPEVLRFRKSKKTNILSAIALEPLIIENNALGYRIHYSLETFHFDFNKSIFSYTGFPFFEFSKGNASKMKKWEKNRKDAYYGSQMHFMRALFRNQIPEEGYEVRALKRIPNLEKQRVRKALDSLHKEKNFNGTAITNGISNDSSTYYNKVMKQGDYIQFMQKDVLTGDSIAYAIDDKTVGLEFEDYLVVLYTKKLAPPEYQPRMFQKNREQMQSFIILINNIPIEVQSTGSYYYPTNLLNQGYWAWSEKIAMMLPFNYQPPKE